MMMRCCVVLLAAVACEAFLNVAIPNNIALTLSSPAKSWRYTVGCAFDGKQSTRWISDDTTSPAWVTRGFPKPRTITGYTLASAETIGINAPIHKNSPRSWVVEGLVGSTRYGSWVRLDSQSGWTADRWLSEGEYASPGKKLTFKATLPVTYLFSSLRFTFTENNDPTSKSINLSEITIY